MPAISFLPFLQTVPLTTRLLTLTLFLASVVAYGLSTIAIQNSYDPRTFGSEIPWLVMAPGESWKFPWTVVTAGWVELSFIELVIALVSLPLASRYLERIWGPRELVRFCIVVIAGSNIIAFGFSWLIHFVIGDALALEGRPYSGQSGLQVGFLVAFTQLIPEHQVQLLGRFKIRVKTLPGIYLLISNLLIFRFGYSPYMLVQFGFFVAWAYLRFFKLSEDGQFRGDRSETFAFQYWFPPFVRPYIAMAGNQVFKLAVRVGLVKPWEEQQSAAYAMLPGPGGARAEAERRRAMALKALDARLASGSPAPTAVSPSTTIPAAGLPTTAASTTAAASVAPPLTKSISSKSITQVGEGDKEAKD